MSEGSSQKIWPLFFSPEIGVVKYWSVRVGGETEEKEKEKRKKRRIRE